MAELDRFFSDVSADLPEGAVFGIIVPHAGLVYSGAVAAQAFWHLRSTSPRNVVIVGRMHHPTRASVLTTAHDGFRTPMGIVPVDRDLLQRLDTVLKSSSSFGLVQVENDPEHSIEVELPFLQYVLGDVPFLPLMIANQRRQVVERLGHALAEVIDGPETLLIASSDLSHFYTQADAYALDQEMLRRIEAFDPEGVLDADENGIAFACGSGAIASVLWAARDLGAKNVVVVGYGTSGDVNRRYDAVVGYGSAVILGQA